MKHPYFAKAAYPRVVAHRGLPSEDEDSAVWENTAAAFAAAHAAGAEYIETDCRVTADGEPVLFHDESLARLLGDPRRVREVRTAELAELLSLRGGLLTVAEALESFPETRFNIDVKEDAAVEPLGPVLAGHTHRVLVTSFADARRRRTVQAVLRAGADLRPAVSGGRGTIAAVRLSSVPRLPVGRILRDVDALQIPLRHGGVSVFTPALLDAAHRHEVEVHVWTVNEPEEMDRLVAAGVDGIVTDRADVAVRRLARP